MIYARYWRDVLATAARMAPSDRMTLTIPWLIAGFWPRREVRAALEAARVLGAEVRYSEQKGLLESVFTIHVDGSRAELDPFIRLRCLAETSRATPEGNDHG